MLRFLVRMIALFVLAAGFADLIVDGTRSIAGGEISVTSLSVLVGARLPALEQAVVRNIHPLLWNPVLLTVLRLPASLVLALVGLLLLRAGRRLTPTAGRVTHT